MGDGGVEHIGVFVLPLGGEIAPDTPAAIDDIGCARTRLEGREARERRGGEALLPLVFGQVEPRVRQRLVVGPRRVLRIGRAAGGVGVGDLRDPLARRLLGPRVEHERRVADIVEKRVELVVEERQPVFEADRAAPLADGGVEIVGGGRGAEFKRIGLTEAADRVGREPRLAHRHEVERAQLSDAALRLGVEGADRFQRIAEKIEPDRRGGAGRIEIENAAARRIVADVAHRARAAVAVRFEPERQIVHAHAVARRGRKGGGSDVAQRRNALRQRADGADQNARPLDRAAGPRKPRERRHALGRNRRVRRHPVVGLAVPGRQVERLDLGRGEAERIDEGLRPHAVTGDEDERDRARFALSPPARG